MGIPQILRDFGHVPEQVFTELGFEPVQFTDPDNKIPFVPTSLLLEKCVAVTGCRHFGLLVGQSADPSSLGIAGFMLRVADDVDTALQGLMRHLDLHDQGGVGTFVKEQATTMLGYEIHLPDVHAQEQILDMSLAVICNIMRALCGRDWNPSRVLLRRPRPDNLEPYNDFFSAPVRFNANQSSVVFPSKWLSHKLDSADPLLFTFLEKRAAVLHARQSFSLLDELRKFITIALVTGHCTASAAAGHFGMHERTLNRRLGEKGTSFRRELEKVRYEKARIMLAQSKASHAEIAWALGYSDGTAFNRSFKRWSGFTPEKWRSINRQHET